LPQRASSLSHKRTQRILADVVRAYVETGEPVSSRAISRLHADPWSAATIRNVMADLEEEGYLYQPHTSAGRIPTAAAFRFFVQEMAQHATMSPEDSEWVRRELNAARTPDEVMERASQVLAAISHGLGIVVTPPLSRTVLEHIRFLLLPDGRVLVVFVSGGGITRDKVIRLERAFTQAELDSTSAYLNSHYTGHTLDDIRSDLVKRLDGDRQRYDQLASNALLLCAPEVLDAGTEPQVFVGGAAQMAAAGQFADQSQLRELLAAIEEKTKLVALLTTCIETPEPVHVQIGIKELSGAGQQLALISAPYACHDRVQGSLGVLGPVRMHYERAITTVAYVAKLFSETLDGGERA
jgi:heat-inducible transcriptional repressor